MNDASTALQPQGPIPGPGDLVNAGLEAFKPNLVPMIVGMLITFVVGLVPILGFVGTLVLMPGMVIMALRAASGKPVEIPHIAGAFKRLVPILLTNLLVLVAIFVGSFFLLIPGLIAGIFLQYSIMLCIDREMEFMDAIMGSVAIVKQDIAAHAILAVICGVVAAVGGVVFIGIFVTFPLAMCMHAVAYHKQFGIQGGADKLVDI